MQDGKDSDSTTRKSPLETVRGTHSQIIALLTHISDSETGTVMYPAFWP